MVEININNEVTVVLTEFGANTYNNYWSVVPKEHRPRELEFGDEIRVTLWNLMQIFGPVISHGMREMPFVDNRIRL